MTITDEYITADIILSDNSIIHISPDDLTGEFSVSSRAVPGSGFELGGVCSSQLSASFVIADADSYNLFGAKIIPRIIRNNYETVLGVFNVTSTKKFRNIISVSASDNMIWLDKAAYKDENFKKVNMIAEYLGSARSVYDALKYIVTDICGLELADSREDIEAMPNGDVYTVVFDDVKTNCPRDWLSWIAEMLGGFAYADEYGRIGIKQFEKISSAEITADMLGCGTLSIADFRMHASKVEMNVWDGSYGAHYAPAYDNMPNTIYIDLSDNWIVQGKHYVYGNAMDVLGNVYGAVSIPYRPFSAVVHSDEIYHLGQCISIEDHDGSVYTTVITNHTYTFGGGQRIQCSGEDSRLLSDVKKRSALKRESEKLQTMIESAKGKNVTESEMNAIIQSGKFRENEVFYIYDDNSEQ